MGCGASDYEAFEVRDFGYSSFFNKQFIDDIKTIYGHRNYFVLVKANNNEQKVLAIHQRVSRRVINVFTRKIVQ